MAAETIRFLTTPEVEALVEDMWDDGADTVAIVEAIEGGLGFRVSEARVANALARVRDRSLKQEAA